MAITLTEKAAREIHAIVRQQREKSPESADKPVYLRVGVKGGGCSGFSYTLDLTDIVAENDERALQHGVEIVCDPKSCLYLNDTTIDFQDSLMGRGFAFSNPKACSTCGCGASFSV